MIKLLLLLCAFLSLQGESILFDLPHQSNAFDGYLHRIFRQNDNIEIVTPSLNHPGIKKELLQHVKNGNSVTLIVQNLKDDPLYLIQYKGIHLYEYQKRPLNGTIIVTDDHVCYLTATLHADRLNREKSFVWCSDEAEVLRQNHTLSNTIKKHSTLYLK